MSTETIVRVTADASGYEAGMEKAKRSAESFLASQEAAAKRTKAAQDAIKEAAENGSKASASAINSFVQSTAKMADTVGKTRSQLLEQKAAALGVTDAMSAYIAKIRETEQAHHKLNFATAGARREMLVLAHEASQGNWKRFAGSLMVLGERTDAMSLIMNKSVLSVGALVGVVALSAEITLKAAEAMGKYGDEIEKLSQRTGASTDAIQQWMFAAKASGIDAKETVKSFSDLGEVQNKAVNGNKDAAAAFAAIGISLKELKSSSPADLLPKIADAFHESADSASKAAVANELFGASGENLIPLLDRGSAGLAALGVEARETGAIIGNDAVHQMASFKQQMELAHAKMDAMTMSAKTELLQTILAVTNAFADNASMGPMLHEFYSDVASIAKGAAIGLAAIVTAAKEAGAGISMMANIANRAGAGDVQGVVDAWKSGIKEIGDAQSSYDAFLQRINSPLQKPVGPPESARNLNHINFSKGEKTPKAPREKAYHDDAAERFVQQLRDQGAELQLQLSTTDKLTNSEKELAKFNQQIADWKGKTLTAEQKSLIAHQDEIRAQLQKNVELDKELQKRNEIQKLTEKSTQINAQIGSFQARNREGYGRQLQAFGMGADAQKQAQEIDAISKEYQRYFDDLDKAAAKSGTLGSDAYLQEKQTIQDGLTESLKDFDDYYTALKQKQDDWTNGTATAFANYIDSAHDAAAQAQSVVTQGMKGMEDAVVKFVTTGKVSFTGLVDGMLADLTRMATHGVMSSLFENLSSFGGSIGGGLFASHPGVAATTASALPGDALDNMMKLTKGFGTMAEQAVPKALGGFGAATQNTASLNAANATVATMTVGTLIGAGGGTDGAATSFASLFGGGGNLFGFTMPDGTAGAASLTDMSTFSSSLASYDGGGMSALMGLGGALATGGPTDAGTPYLVGEKGPEVFIPAQSGRVIPNHALTINDGGTSQQGAPGMSQMFNMNITVPEGTTRATANQQARAIMERAQIAQWRNG